MILNFYKRSQLGQLQLYTSEPKFTGAHVNADMLGNHKIFLMFSRPITSSLALDAGITLEITHDQVTYYTITSAVYTVALGQANKAVVFTLTGLHFDIHKPYTFRITYDDGVGDLKNATDNTAVISFGPNEVTCNASEVNVLGKYQQNWELTETAGLDKVAKQSVPSNLQDFLDANTVGITTGLLGENACLFTGTEWLGFLGHSGGTDQLQAPADGRFWFSFYVKMTSMPTENSAYLWMRYTGLGTVRTFATRIDSSDSLLYATGFDSNDKSFEAKCTNLGVMTLAQWYGILVSFDPGNVGSEVIVYSQKSGDDTSFKIDTRNMFQSGSTFQCRVENNTRHAIGRIPDRPDIDETDAAITLPIFGYGSITETEARSVLRNPITHPFLVTLS